MKIVTIIGARPQFIKAAMVSRAIARHNQHHHSKIEEYILHTGQHYDPNMSEIFFTDMQIPLPAWTLSCGHASHGEMTGRMLMEIEKILIREKPDKIIVYGDTNSTLAGALAASKLLIPIVHVEAGLRSFNRTMPEEQNRILTDHLSTLLCCPTFAAIRNLEKEGIQSGVHHVGDVMYDAALTFGALAEKQSAVLSDLNLEDQSFILCTLHRAENTNQQERITAICEALHDIASAACPVVFPLHPRTAVYLKEYGLYDRLLQNPAIRITEPLGYLDICLLEKKASCLLTDSGGMQKEAYFHQTPCITLRDETEWIETVDAGWNQLAGASPESIKEAISAQPERKKIHEYGTGHAAEVIIDLL